MHNPETAPTERVRDWKTSRQWVAESGGEIFQTRASFDWFVRQHRERLIQTGQYIPRPGSGGSLVGPSFDSVVLEILRDQVRDADRAA